MKKIILYDMNYFYAQCEERDDISLVDKAVIVGGKPGERGGIVGTCNYKAREYGVRSGMSSTEAYYLCPEGVFVKPRMKVYYKAHEEIRAIVEEYTPEVEYVALDEAYLDVTGSERIFGSAEKIAREIQEKIYKVTNLTCSIGIGYSKMSAKIAAEKIKPKGFYILDTKEKFLEELSDKKVGIIPGIGKRVEDRLNKLGVYRVEDLQKIDYKKLEKEFKPVMTKWLKEVAFGIDTRKVITFYKEKSIGRSVTLLKNTNDMRIIINSLIDIIELLSYKLALRKEFAMSVTLKIRWKSMKVTLKSHKVREGINSSKEIYDLVLFLLEKVQIKEEVRGVGVSLGNLSDKKYKQLKLGQVDKMEKEMKIDRLKMDIRNKYGYKIMINSLEYMKKKDKNGEIIKNNYLKL